MNKANMLALASFLDTLPDDKFYMRAWLADKTTHEAINEWGRAGECGTTGCVAGWAAVVAIPFKAARVNWLRENDIQDTAKGWLELSNKESKFLFHGDWAAKTYPGSAIGDGTPKEAAAAIRKMVEVGGIFDPPERLREWQVSLSASKRIITVVTVQAHDSDDAEAVALRKAEDGQVEWETTEDIGPIHVDEVDDA